MFCIQRRFNMLTVYKFVSCKFPICSRIIVALCLLYQLQSSYAQENNANEWIPSGSITVEEFRILFPNINGDSITVLGALLPYYNSKNSVIVNAGLVPNKDYLKFDRHTQKAFSISLLNVTIREGGTSIKKECFGEWVTVTGTAILFSGTPAIDDIAFIQKADSDHSCMKNIQ